MKSLLLLTMVVLVIFVPACSCTVGDNGQAVETFSYKDDFASLDTDFWSVLTWVTLEDASTQVSINQGILSVEATVVDRVPFLLSRPIAISSGDIVTIERKVKLDYGNPYFDGALFILGAEDETVEVFPGSAGWNENIRDYKVVVNYLYYQYEPDNKPTTDGFVLRAESTDGTPYIVSQSIFGEWFTEKLTWDTASGQVTYEYNGTTLTGTVSPLDKDYIRIMLHCYGWYTGHSMDMEYFYITVSSPD